MAQQEINFLKGKEAEIRKERGKLLLIKLLSFGAVIIYVLAVVVTVVFHYLKKNELKSLNSQINTVEEEIAAMSSAETKQRYLYTKLNAIIPILSTKRDHQSLVNFVFSLLPKGVSVSNFQIQDKNTLSFDTSSNDFRAVKGFFENLKKDNTQMKIAEVKITNFGFNEENKYFAAVQLSLDEDLKNEN